MADQGTAAPTSAPSTTQTGADAQTPVSNENQVKTLNPTPENKAKTWKAKVDGQEVAWEKEEDLLRDASLGKAAYKRMGEAAQIRKEAEKFWEDFQKDPMAALENPRLKLTDEQRRAAIEQYYKKKWLETDNLSPEQKELRQLREWKEAQEKEVKTRAEREKQEVEAKQRTELESKWKDTYQQQIIEAIEKGGLPKTPKTAARVAYYMAHALNAGFDAPLESIIAQVNKDYEEEIQAIAHDDIPIEAILKLLPKNLVKRLRKYDIDQYKAKTNPPPPVKQEVETTPRAPRTKKDDRMSYAEVLKKLGS